MSDSDLLIGRALGQLYHRENKTESYVEIPPAFVIVDSDGAAWTFGFEYNNSMEFNVLRNDVNTEEFASKIVYEKGVVWLYGSAGRRHFSRSRRHFI